MIIIILLNIKLTIHIKIVNKYSTLKYPQTHLFSLTLNYHTVVVDEA